MSRLWRMLLAAWCLLGAASAGAGIAVDAERELQLLGQGVTPPRIFGNIAFRVAVFSYEDPDKLGLGDALAALVGHEVLTGSRVSALGVLRYVGRLTPRPDEAQGYFDKVELLTASQQPTVALWGMVRRDDQQLVIESYLQIPESTMARGLQARLTLPAAMGRGELRARLGADRLLLQRRLLPLEAVAQLRAAASRLGELRAKPGADAAVVARLPLQTVYYLKERRGDWLRVATSASGSTPAASGWVPRSGHCTGACAPLTAGPRFVSELLAFIEKRRPPEPADTLATDAQQLRDQMLAMAALDQAPAEFADREAISILGRWLPRPDDVAAYAPAAGAGSANLRLLARLTGELRRARLRLDPRDAKAYDRLQLPPEMVRAATYEAAEATVVDPNNVDLLHNLRVLYAALGDRERATLAANLLERAGSSSRQRLLPSR